MTIASGLEDKTILPPLPPKRHSHKLPSAEDYPHGTLAKCLHPNCEKWFYRYTFMDLEGAIKPFPCWSKVGWFAFKKRARIKQEAYHYE